MTIRDGHADLAARIKRIYEALGAEMPVPMDETPPYVSNTLRCLQCGVLGMNLTLYDGRNLCESCAVEGC